MSGVGSMHGGHRVPDRSVAKLLDELSRTPDTMMGGIRGVARVSPAKPLTLRRADGRNLPALRCTYVKDRVTREVTLIPATGQALSVLSSARRGDRIAFVGEPTQWACGDESLFAVLVLGARSVSSEG